MSYLTTENILNDGHLNKNCYTFGFEVCYINKLAF